MKDLNYKNIMEQILITTLLMAKKIDEHTMKYFSHYKALIKPYFHNSNFIFSRGLFIILRSREKLQKCLQLEVKIENLMTLESNH